MRRGEIFDWLRKCQKEGKIKNFGASVESMDEALICLEQPDFASLQIIFNIFRQKPIVSLFPHAKEKEVAIIVRLPLAADYFPERLTRTRNSPRPIIAPITATGSSSMWGKLLPACHLRRVSSWQKI